MIPIRVLAVLLLAVLVGVAIDVLTGVSVPGYGAGLGAAGVVVLTVVAHLLGRVLRRATDPDEHQEFSAGHEADGEVGDG